jgi:predicted phage terminase large subunit-like protein
MRRGLIVPNLTPSTPDASRYQDYLRATLPEAWDADADHIRLICQHLDAVERGEIDRLAIHMPPRHGKSETVTYRFPVRWLEKRPTDNVLVTGYNERFARKFGRRSRNIARERGLVSEDKAAADEWETTAGGLYMARGVGSPPTGTGFQLIVIDDPIRRREDAESETYRKKAWDWYTDDLYTRLEPGGVIVLIMTLWHEGDIGARAIASEPGRWHVLKLPALAEAGDLLNRPEGAALWPARYDVEALARVRSVMTTTEGERSFQAVYQQNPTAPEGDLFKVFNLKFQDAAPAGLLRTVRAWDLAASEGKGDWTAGVKIGRSADGLFYVLGVARGQWGPDEGDKQIKLAANLDGRNVSIRGAIDPGSAGKRDAAAITRMLAGYDVKTEHVTGPKGARARGFAAQVNAGNVVIIKAPWNTAFVEELRTFPNGTHDDQVDAAADAFNDLTLPAPGKPASAPRVAQQAPSEVLSGLR